MHRELLVIAVLSGVSAVGREERQGAGRCAAVLRCGAVSTAQAGCCSSPAEAGARGGGSAPAAYRGNPPSGMSPAPPAAPGNDPTPLYNELRDA